MASVLVVGSASAQTPVNCDGLKNSLRRLTAPCRIWGQFPTSGCAPRLVCSFPDSGHVGLVSARPFRANLGSRRCHSITLSARPVTAHAPRSNHPSGTHQEAFAGFPKDNLLGQYRRRRAGSRHVAAVLDNTGNIRDKRASTRLSTSTSLPEGDVISNHPLA